MIGKIYSSYRITRPLGEGGMGVVYEAEHVQVGRKAAIKVLLPEWSNNEIIVERFFNEARSSVLANHPGIVEIFDCGWADDGKAYLVMELLEGQPLSELLAAEGPLSVQRMTSIARQIAAALGAAHEKGIVHRDLKPDNTFVIPDRYAQGGERIKVLDFGVAKLAHARREQIVAGAMLGTPLYMSPEQCKASADVDARGDIYALACIMFEMVCGRPPFVHDDPAQVAAMQIQEAPLPPRSLRPDLPRSVDSLILRCLAKDRERRPQSMAALRAELDVVWSLLPPDARLISGQEAPPAPASPGVQVIKVPMTTMRDAAAEIASPRPSASGASRKARLSRAASMIGLGSDIKARSARRPTFIGAAAAAAVLVMALVVALRLAGRERTPARASGIAATASGTSSESDIGSSLVKMRIDSTPEGAQVFVDDQDVGRTPLERAFRRGSGVMRARLELPGYRPERIEIAADRDTSSTVVLQPYAPGQ